MSRGTQQILRFGLESAYGVAVVPTTTLGVITGGRIQEGTKVHSFYGPESKWVVSQQYGAVDCGGSCNLIVGDLNVLSWASLRASAVSPLYSWTMDGGYAAAPATVRRMSGCKCGNLNMSLDQDQPITASVDWVGKEVVDAGSISGPSSPTGLFWVMQGATMYFNSTPIAGLQSFELRVENNLTRKYLTNRQNTNLRAITRINEGKQKISVTVNAWTRLSNPVRSNIPLYGGIEVLLLCQNPILGTWLTIRLGGCYRETTEEVLDPLKLIEYGYSFAVSSIAFV